MSKTNDEFNVKPDLATKIFMEKPDIFADAVNFAVYNGNQVVKAESLESAPTVATSFVYNGSSSAVTFEKIRDVRKVVRLSPDDRTAYMIFGAENQSHLHYAMPVKTMLYDIMEYADQIDARRKNFKTKKSEGNESEIPKPKVSPDEFLSSWKADDKLVTVVSVVINFSDRKWDAPLSLHEMFDKEPPERYNIIKELIPDYRIILIDPHQMDDSQIKNFKTNLGTVMTFIKNADDKQKLIDKFESEENKNMELDRESVMVINACTGARLPLPEKDEVITVCKGIEDLKKDVRLETKSDMIKALKANGASEELIQATLRTMQEEEMKKNNQ